MESDRRVVEYGLLTALYSRQSPDDDLRKIETCCDIE
jgi:hypothetical protein